MAWTAGKMSNSVNQTICTFSHMPKAILEGVSVKGQQFMGLESLISTLENFKNESPIIENQLPINFDNISDSKIDIQSELALDAAKTFSNKNKGCYYL